MKHVFLLQKGLQRPFMLLLMKKYSPDVTELMLDTYLKDVQSIATTKYNWINKD